MTSRIRGHAVLPLAPATGDVRVLIVGEAPGPRGADKSGIPFFGDAAGKHLYAALRAAGAIDLPSTVDAITWDGQALVDARMVPVARGVALTNAFDRCPTDDGAHFRAPRRDELESSANTARLTSELDVLVTRGLRTVLTLGKVAERTLQRVLEAPAFAGITLEPLPHPSAQGLLSMAPNRGRGARMADLQAMWIARCVTLVRNAGASRA